MKTVINTDSIESFILMEKLLKYIRPSAKNKSRLEISKKVKLSVYFSQISDQLYFWLRTGKF